MAGFKRAAEAEYTSLMAKGTFRYIPTNEVSKDLSPLPLMWVFTYKFDVDGYLLKYKARLVARGDLQTGEEETYAATLAAQTFKVVIALMTAFGLKIRQYDAINAFANAGLINEIPAFCAEGFERDGHLLWLQKALYGLKISPLLWYNHLSNTLEKLGFRTVPDTNCLFVSHSMILIFYVDDILILYEPKDQQLLNDFEVKLLQSYELRILGEIEHFLGIRVIRDEANRKTWLLQDTYIERIAERFNIKLSKHPPRTPLPNEELLPYTSIASPEQIHGYQQRVGSINYPATIVRADVATASSKLAKFLLNPSPKHVEAADHCIEYLLSTKYLGQQFDGDADQQEVFMTFADSSFADDKMTRTSSHGFCVKLYGGLIDFKAIKGKTVTTSSTEAELLAISYAARVFLRWLRLFQNINFYFDFNPKIYCDNHQTILILTKEAPKLKTALRHIDIHQSWLRQEVQAGKIAVEWVPAAKMVADGFTKLLPAQAHLAFIKLMGMVDLKAKFNDSKGHTKTTSA